MNEFDPQRQPLRRGPPPPASGGAGGPQQELLRRLRHTGNGAFVQFFPVTEAEFAHLPALEPSACFHLFLSRASSG